MGVEAHECDQDGLKQFEGQGGVKQFEGQRS